jgi:hypothetical protein
MLDRPVGATLEGFFSSYCNVTVTSKRGSPAAAATRPFCAEETLLADSRGRGVLTRCIIYSQNDASVSERACAPLWTARHRPPPTWTDWSRSVLAIPLAPRPRSSSTMREGYHDLYPKHPNPLFMSSSRLPILTEGKMCILFSQFYPESQVVPQLLN